MGISLKPQHLNRYRQIAWLFVKYGRARPGQRNRAGRRARSRATRHPARKRPRRTSWPPIWKSWARLSSSSGNCSPPASSSCRRPTSTRSRVCRTKSSRSALTTWRRSSRRNWASVFRKPFPTSKSRRWPRPHSGRCTSRACAMAAPVAVKVQRPEIRDAMVEDLDALEEIAEFLDDHTEMGKRYEFTATARPVSQEPPARTRLPPGSEQSHHDA